MCFIISNNSLIFAQVKMYTFVVWGVSSAGLNRFIYGKDIKVLQWSWSSEF